ncbi:MAG TPA: hypothetical protein VLW65_00850 [Bryobacteraceae bacterium]|nr:hypothetical protein [Bryobacteraceae bacterium]
MRPYFLLFLLLSVVYHSNLRPIAAGDSLPSSLIPFSVMLDGSIALDRFGPYLDKNVPYAPGVIRKAKGHWYSMYPIAGPLLATPLYLPAALIPAVRRQSPAALVSIARIAEKVTAVAWAAAAALSLFALLRRLAGGRAAWILTLIYALGTGNWATASQAMWQHTFALPAIVACLYAVERWSGERKWYWMAGAAAACALAIRPTNAALLPALALVLWHERARLRAYAEVFCVPVLAGAATAAYNFTLFHSIGGRYSAQMDARYLERIAGLLASPGRGLLIYTPVALFALAAFGRGARHLREKHMPVVLLAAAFSLGQIALTAAWPVWWGGYCWGPRLLTEILPCLMVLMAVGWPAFWHGGWKGTFAAAALYGCLIQALGVYCYPKGHWDRLPVSVDARQARLWDWKDNPMVRTAHGGFAWEPYAVVGAAARGGLPAAAQKMKDLGIKPY